MTEIKNLDEELSQQIYESSQLAELILNATKNDAPKVIIEKLVNFVNAARASEQLINDDHITPLGVLLGNQYVLGLGWHWGEVVWDGDESTASVRVLNPDNSLSIQPIWWVDQSITTDRPVNFLLNYNMVEAGNIPISSAGEAAAFH